MSRQRTETARISNVEEPRLTCIIAAAEWMVASGPPGHVHPADDLPLLGRAYAGR